MRIVCRFCTSVESIDSSSVECVPIVCVVSLDDGFGVMVFFFCQRSANHRWIDRITCGCVLHCKSFCCWPQLLQHCKKTFLRWSKKKNGKHLKTVDYIYLELRLLSQYLWNKSVLIWEDTAKRAWTKTKTKMKQSKMNEAKLKPNRAHRHTLT